jgi:hypothetical protein
VPDALLQKLRTTVGAANVLTGVELSPYVVEGRTPEAAIFPGSIEEVAAVMALASGCRPVAPGSSWGSPVSAGSWTTSPAI